MRDSSSFRTQGQVHLARSPAYGVLHVWLYPSSKLGIPFSLSLHEAPTQLQYWRIIWGSHLTTELHGSGNGNGAPTGSYPATNVPFPMGTATHPSAQQTRSGARTSLEVNPKARVHFKQFAGIQPASRPPRVRCSRLPLQIHM
jgi:hypothetical protein